MDGAAEVYDIVIIGGGINGCGIARDAAGRGLSVLLAEKDDLASGTSSASTKLIHGGLRYLENYEFRLVRESLAEREVLFRMAPHIIRPLRFVLPHRKQLRPAWLIRLGLFLYDHLGRRELLPPCAAIDLNSDPAGRPLKPVFGKAFEYSDCRVDDARLVVLSARDAAERGAKIRVRAEMLSAVRGGGVWNVQLADKIHGGHFRAKARALVNAAGPWVAEVLGERIEGVGAGRVRLVKGSHIVVPKIFDHERAYIFQNADGRIIFAIPYETDFTLIGTTDVDYREAPAAVRASDDEIDYLCLAASEYFNEPVNAERVVWSYSGIRPLLDDGQQAAQKATRDYILDLRGASDEPPLLNVFGGKITTYRRLAEEAMAKLAPWFAAAGPAWTAGSVLPGGDFAVGDEDSLVDRLAAAHPCLERKLLVRLVNAYGTDASEILAGVSGRDDLGRQFGAGLSEREVRYLIDREWALAADDIVWRRSKLGLRMNESEIGQLDQWIGDNA